MIIILSKYSFLIFSVMQRRANCFVDVLPRLGVARVIVSPTEACCMSFTKHTLTTFHRHPADCVGGESNEVLVYPNLPGFDPGTASQCHYTPCDGIHMRFRVPSTTKSYDPVSPYNIELSSASPDSTALVCVFCGEVLTETL